VVSELSPYEADLDWADITEPEEIARVLNALGRATAKVHCSSDQDSDEDLVDFQTETAIADAIGADVDAFVAELVEFAMKYAVRARKDHALFVDAFRGAKFDLVAAT
jgi:2-hydroxychromene-2-carboxylate isomerase